MDTFLCPESQTLIYHKQWKGCGSACVVTGSSGMNVEKKDNSLSSISEITEALFQATL